LISVFPSLFSMPPQYKLAIGRGKTLLKSQHSLKRLRQENGRLEASLSYIVSQNKTGNISGGTHL
jgi:hypothetical protein